MKKVKYLIYFENVETSMSTQFEISKSEYNKQFNFLMQQVSETKENETPVTVMPVRKYDHETTIETITPFNCGCAYVDLTKIECKEGYCFARKAKKKVKS